MLAARCVCTLLGACAPAPSFVRMSASEAVAPPAPGGQTWPDWGVEAVDPTYIYEQFIWKLRLPPGAVMRSDGCTINELVGGVDLPTFASGETLQLSQDREHGIGGQVWRGTGAMCRWQKTCADDFRGASVLELGAGTGLTGLHAASLGARQVVLTDGGSDSLISQLATNAAQNRELLRRQGCESIEAEKLWRGSRQCPAQPT